MKPNAFTLDHTAVVIPASSLPAPKISYDVGKQVWRLEETYSYTDSGHVITIAAPFDFDLASIPRALWWLIAPFELSIAAPMIHDFLYQHKGSPPPGSIVPPITYSRKKADELFRHLMKLEGIAAWRRRLAYRAVRLFGWYAWGGEVPASHRLV